MISLSIVICTYNRAGSLKRCLASLVKQSRKDFEVLVVDGGSTDETVIVITEFTKKLTIKTIVYTEKELAKVRDKGWREASGKLVCWTDDDVITTKTWVESIIATFADKSIGGVSGPTVIPASLINKRDVFSLVKPEGIMKVVSWVWKNYFLEGKSLAVGRITRCGAWTPGSNFPTCLTINGLVEVDYLEACNMTLRRSLVAKVDGFDFGYTKVAEWCELDLAMRVAELGYRLVFNPKVLVEHHVSQSGVFSKRTHARQRMENFMKFYFRHKYKPRLDYLVRFIPYLFFLNGYWSYKFIQSRNVSWLGGWVGTITGLRYAKFK